jgi:undecaprenyl-diphosphatase
MDTFFILGAKYLFLVSAVIAIVYFWKYEKRAWKRTILFTGVALILTYILGHITGHFFYNARPFVADNFTPLIPHAPDNGFPSDHTLLAAGIAAVFLYLDRKAAIYLWIIAIIVGISRVYVGVHHPLDIIGSICFALIGTFIAHIALRKSGAYEKLS